MLNKIDIKVLKHLCRTADDPPVVELRLDTILAEPVRDSIQLSLTVAGVSTISGMAHVDNIDVT
jgi:hypothetical protein